MKPIILLSAVLMFSTFMACKPDEIVVICEEKPVCHDVPAPIYSPGEMTYGRVAGLKNCLPFFASATAFIGNAEQKLVGLEIRTFEDWGHFFANKETISIGSRAYGLGTWPLLIDSIPNVTFQRYSIVQDHDVFEDVYEIDTTFKFNRIFLTKIDSTMGQIQGSFDARFLISSSFPSGKNPDTVTFTECHFIANMP